MYAVYLFKASNSPLSPFKSTIIVGALRIICTFTGARLMDKFGRRPLLLTSSIICMSVLAVIGGIHIMEDSSESGKWVSVTCIYMYVASYGIGLGPVPWTLLGELIPSPVRSIGCSLVVAAFGGSAFLMTNTFLDLVNLIGIGGALLFFCFCTLIFVFIVGIWVPETRGKTLLELEDVFSVNDIENEPSTDFTSHDLI